jgi:hypothetical protein
VSAAPRPLVAGMGARDTDFSFGIDLTRYERRLTLTRAETAALSALGAEGPAAKPGPRWPRATIHPGRRWPHWSGRSTMPWPRCTTTTLRRTSWPAPTPRRWCWPVARGSKGRGGAGRRRTGVGSSAVTPPRFVRRLRGRRPPRCGLARHLTRDLRRPWEKPLDAHRLTPGRVRRGFPRIHAATARPATAPKLSRPGPGRPKGVPNSSPAPRYPVGKQSTVDTSKPRKRAKSG